MNNNMCDCLNNEAQLESIIEGNETLNSSLDSESNIESGLGSVIEVSRSTIKRYSSKSEFPNVGDDDILYIALDENSSYIWKDNKYVCIGRDYTEIEQINGGGA